MHPRLQPYSMHPRLQPYVAQAVLGDVRRVRMLSGLAAVPAAGDRRRPPMRTLTLTLTLSLTIYLTLALALALALTL